MVKHENGIKKWYCRQFPKTKKKNKLRQKKENWGNNSVSSEIKALNTFKSHGANNREIPRFWGFDRIESIYIYIRRFEQINH